MVSRIRFLEKLLEKKKIEGTDYEIRENLLKLMYLWTFLIAGMIGIFIVFAPEMTQSLLGIPKQDSIMFGVLGSLWMAFGLLALIGFFRDPIKFVPILLVQLTYKIIWYVAVVIPVAITQGLQFHAILMVIIFATYVIGDFFVIPFKFLFEK